MEFTTGIDNIEPAFVTALLRESTCHWSLERVLVKLLPLDWWQLFSLHDTSQHPEQQGMVCWQWVDLRSRPNRKQSSC
jgi:hypothetical protein